jgi:hypothetical protein
VRLPRTTEVLLGETSLGSFFAITNAELCRTSYSAKRRQTGNDRAEASRGIVQFKNRWNWLLRHNAGADRSD